MLRIINENEVRMMEIPISQQIANGLTYLCNMQNVDGSICHTRSIWNIWETILCLQAIAFWYNADQLHQIPQIDKALKFLKQCENSQGMLFHENQPAPEIYRPLDAQEKTELAELLLANSDDFHFEPRKTNISQPNMNVSKWNEELVCQETTAEYVALLATLNAHQINPSIQKKLDCMAAMQSPTGCWRARSTLPEYAQSYPSVTGFVLKAFTNVNYHFSGLQLSLKYLCDTQNKNGHWGADWIYLGYPFYAMDPILEVLAYYKVNDAGIARARNFLLASQKNDGSWFYQLKGWDIYHLPSAAQQTALALKCCYHCGLDIHHPSVKKAVDFLLNEQHEDGHWYGGFFAFPAPMKIHKQEDIYTTAQVLQALYLLLGTKEKLCL